MFGYHRREINATLEDSVTPATLSFGYAERAVQNSATENGWRNAMSDNARRVRSHDHTKRRDYRVLDQANDDRRDKAERRAGRNHADISVKRRVHGPASLERFRYGASDTRKAGNAIQKQGREEKWFRPPIEVPEASPA